MIVGTHGLHGELKMRLTTDDPEHLLELQRVYVADEERPRRLVGIRSHGEQALIRLAGVSTLEEGQALRGVPVRIAGTDARAPVPGEFFLYQLIGLTAFDEADAVIGTVTDLIETGTYDVLVITPDDGPDVLIPNSPEFVPVIEPEAGRMVVRPLDYGGDARSGSVGDAKAGC